MDTGGKLDSLYMLPCGCSLRDGGIYFCGLHGSAGLLLKALKMFVEQHEHLGHDCWPVSRNNPESLLPKAVAAIRAAEWQGRGVTW